jgi:hypothetical protein
VDAKLGKLKRTGEGNPVLLAAQRPLRPEADWDEPPRFLISNKTEVVLERGTLWRYMTLPEALDAPTARLACSWIARLPLPTPSGLATLPVPALSEAQLERLTITRLAERVTARLGAAQLHARGHREAASVLESNPASRFAAAIQDLRVATEAPGPRVSPTERLIERVRESERAALCGLAEAKLVESRAALQLAALLLPDAAPWSEAATGAAAHGDAELSGVHDVQAALAVSREARRRAGGALLSSRKVLLPAKQRVTAAVDDAQQAEQGIGLACPTPAELIGHCMREARALLDRVEVVLGSADAGGWARASVGRADG